MPLLLLTAYVFLARVDLDGEAAVERARSILASIGFRQPMTLQSLSMVGDFRDRGGHKVWGMILTDSHGKFMLHIDPATKQLVWLQTPFMSEAPTYAKDPPSPATRNLAQLLLAKLGYDKDVDLQDDSGNRAIPYHATFLLKVHGLYFFNYNPTYGHHLTIYPASATVAHFIASPPLPAVDAWKPAVSADTARRSIAAWAADRAKKNRRQPFDVSHLEPELGYWKFKSEPKARLVWRAMHYIAFGGRSLPQGYISAYVDATTGEIVIPDDPAWHDYP